MGNIFRGYSLCLINEYIEKCNWKVLSIKRPVIINNYEIY